MHVEDWFVLCHRRGLYHRKLPEPIARSWRYNQCAPYPNISTTCRHLQWNASHKRYSAERSTVQTSSFCRQGQRVVVLQLSPQLVLRALRNIDAAMGPTV